MVDDLSDCSPEAATTASYYVVDIPDEEEIERNKRLGIGQPLFSITVHLEKREIQQQKISAWL